MQVALRKLLCASCSRQGALRKLVCARARVACFVQPVPGSDKGSLNDSGQIYLVGRSFLLVFFQIAESHRGSNQVKEGRVCPRMRNRSLRSWFPFGFSVASQEGRPPMKHSCSFFLQIAEQAALLLELIPFMARNSPRARRFFIWPRSCTFKNLTLQQKQWALWRSSQGRFK